MTHKFKITYTSGRRHSEVVIETTSKYDAKQRFYRLYPNREIVRIEVTEDE